jgi:hypothetical protein
LASARDQKGYRELVKQMRLPDKRSEPSPEEELDALIKMLKERGQGKAGDAVFKSDAIQDLREQMINELIPVFMGLVEKYAEAGISMLMDASNFLQGGREVRFEFGVGEHRAHLLGTVTTEAIAFHETRYTPSVQGELVSGPMLRLRNLNGQVFRDFICERVTLLLRSALRRH